MNDDVANEYAFLWDGTESGWVVVKSAESSSGRYIFNLATRSMLLVEIDALNEELCDQMLRAGCALLEGIPEPELPWKPS